MERLVKEVGMRGRRTVGAAHYWPMQEGSHHKNRLLQWNFVAV